MREPVVPIFPLPSYFLFPGAASPLRVFEFRYRAMVNDLLDGPGRLVMATIAPGHEHEASGAPPLLPVGGLGEIARHRSLPNGEYLMWVVGLGRVRIDEVASHRPYRLTRVQMVEETEPRSPETFSLRMSLRKAIEARSREELELDDDTSIGLLADILTQCLPLDPEQLRGFFDEFDPLVRAQRALAEHRMTTKGSSD